MLLSESSGRQECEGGACCNLIKEFGKDGMASLVIKYHLLALFLDKGLPVRNLLVVRKRSGLNFWEANFIFCDILVLLRYYNLSNKLC